MTHKLANLVKQTSLSSGATSLTLTPGSHVNPNRSFADVLSSGDTTEVMVVDRGSGIWQAGVYRFSGVLTLVSDHWLASSTGSVVTFSPGLKDVYIASLAERFDPLRRTADFTAIQRFRYDVDTSGGPITATLPADMAEADEVQFSDFAGTWDTNNFTVDPNGQEFEDLGDGSDPSLPMTCAEPARFVLRFSSGKIRPR